MFLKLVTKTRLFVLCVLFCFPHIIFAVDVSLKLSSPQLAGKVVNVEWTGPNQNNDMIVVVAKGAAEGGYINYSYTRKGSPLELRLPDKAGEFEVRYLDGKNL